MAYVYTRTDGNALFMVNIVEHLVQQGGVVRQAGQWTLREGTEAPVQSLPAGLQALLLRRIEALAPEARRVLETASVVGEEFAVAAVAAGAQGTVEAVEAQCEAVAAQRHFLDDIGVAVWPDGTRGGRGIGFSMRCINRCCTSRWGRRGGCSCTSALARGWRQGMGRVRGRSRPCLPST